MNDIASVQIEGRLVRDAEFRKTPTDKSLTEFSVAVNSRFGVSYFDVECWGTLAEQTGSLLKGQTVRITGRLHQNRWKDAEERSHSRVKVVGHTVAAGPVSGNSSEFTPAAKPAEAAV